MSYASVQSVSLTTTAGGAATGYSEVANGRILAITYDGGFDNTADFTITTEDTGQTVWTESNVTNAATYRAPRLATHGTDGVALLYAAGGTAVTDHVWAVGERVKFVIAQGGNAKTGVFKVIFG